MSAVVEAVSVYVVVGSGYAQASHGTRDAAIAHAREAGAGAAVVRFTYGDDVRSRQVVWPVPGLVQTDDAEVVYSK